MPPAASRSRSRSPAFAPVRPPRDIVERTVGRPALLQEAVEQLLPEVYNEAVESEAIEAIGQPEFELQSTEPLIVQAKVPVRPTIELNDHAALRAPREEANATAEQLEAALTGLQRRFATLEPADRAVQWGDTVRADVTVTVNGEDEHIEEDAEFRVEQGTVVSLPGFLERVVGLERGGPHEISFTLPDDFEAADLAGKDARYLVQLHEVKQEVLPELDDEFVRSLDEDGIETVDQLQARIDEDVQKQVQAEALAAYQDEVLDMLLASAELDYPEVLVEREVDRLLDRQSNHASHTAEELEQWLQRIGQSEQEVREGLRDAADLSVRRALALAEFARREALEVAEERIDDELDQMTEQLMGDLDDSERRASMRAMFDTDEGRASIRDRLVTAVALERLVEICSQPDEAAAERPRGSRRRRPRQTEGTEDTAAESAATAAVASDASEEADDPA